MIREKTNILGVIYFIFCLFCFAQDIAGNNLSIQHIVKNAIKQKKSEVNIPNGIYHLTKPIVIYNAKNLVINGNNSTLIMKKLDTAIKISRCKNLTLKNLKIDYNPLPFTQGTIISKSKNSDWFEIKLHKGYPLFSKEYAVKWIHVFDKKTRQWKKGVPDIYLQKVKITSPDKAMLFTRHKEKNVEVGDLVAMNIRNRRPGIKIYNLSKRIKLENLTIYTCCGTNIFSRSNYGDDIIDKVTIKRGPKPDGAIQDRLLSSSADGLNYASVRKGPVIKNCDWGFMGDDSVNLHSSTFPVVFLSDNCTIYTARTYGREQFIMKLIKPGDKVRFLDKSNFAIKAVSEIESVTHTASPNSSDEKFGSQYFTGKAHARSYNKTKKITYYKIKLKKPVSVKLGDFFDVPNISAPGFVIKNNHFHNHRARGLRIMSFNGIIENNTFENIKSSAAIALGAEYAYWRESGWPENIIVKNNILRNIGTAGASPYAYTPGAISLFSRLEKSLNSQIDNTQQYANDNSNIIIEGNVIENSPASAIHINAAKDIRVINNKIYSCNQMPSDKVGSVHNLSAEYAIVVENSRDVTVKGNKLQKPGKYCKGKTNLKMSN